MREPSSTAAPTVPWPEPAVDLSVADWREAAAELGNAMRALTEAVVRSELPPDQLRATVPVIAELTATLSAQRRSTGRLSDVDDFALGVRYFSPVIGQAHPTSPPFTREIAEDGSLIARGCFGMRFEGPPGFVHGGVISMVFDEILGWSAVQSRLHAMTASLEVSYRRAVPLDEPVVIASRVTRMQGRKAWSEARLTLAADPATLLASATALFVQPREELHQQYFGDTEPWVKLTH